MSDIPLTTEQRNFLALFGLEATGMQYRPRGVIRTLADALAEATTATTITVRRREDDGDPMAARVDLPAYASIETWMDMTEGLRQGIIPRTDGSSAIGHVTLSPVKGNGQS